VIGRANDDVGRFDPERGHILLERVGVLLGDAFWRDAL
jgi:hypothetical protein